MNEQQRQIRKLNKLIRKSRHKRPFRIDQVRAIGPAAMKALSGRMVARARHLHQRKGELTLFPTVSITIEIMTGDDEADDVVEALYNTNGCRPSADAMPLNLKIELRDKIVDLITEHLARHELEAHISAF